MRADVCYVSQEVAGIYSSMWDAVKEMPGAQQEYGSKAGARHPYNSKFKKILSRKFALLAEENGNKVEKEAPVADEDEEAEDAESSAGGVST